LNVGDKDGKAAQPNAERGVRDDAEQALEVEVTVPQHDNDPVSHSLTVTGLRVGGG
jgi:hypothetical protein